MTSPRRFWSFRAACGRPDEWLTNDRITRSSPTAGLVWHPGDLAQPDRAAPRAQHPRPATPILPGLRPGCRVVALGEVDGMPHPARINQTPAHAPGHPGDLPPGEGITVDFFLRGLADPGTPGTPLVEP